MGFGHVSINLTFKHMTALRKYGKSVADYFSNYCFRQHAIIDDDCKD